jgi:lipoprotein NlpD
MNNIRLALLAAVSIALVACSSPSRQPAPVVDRSPARPELAKTEAPKPKVPEGRGWYVVKKSDTLYRIALEFGQNYRDLVVWNNLSSPNDIKVDQVLRVLPPEAAATAAGAQTGSVAAGNAVEVRPLGTATAGAATAGAVNKSGPPGDKRPYSESALAELQKPDTGANDVKPAGTNTTAATVAPTLPEDEAVSWMWPAEGKVVGTFDGGKKGIDIAGRAGQPVLAAGSGTVLYASSVRGYGNLVIVKHTTNLLSAYAHNKTILVKEGQTVSKGQKIAEMGNSDTDAVKLHFEIRQQGKPVDPAKFLPAR